MTESAVPVLVTMSRRGVNHFALVSYPKSEDVRPRPGRGHDREGALADALHCSQVFYSDQDVEREVLRSQLRRSQVKLMLKGDTLFPVPPVG